MATTVGAVFPLAPVRWLERHLDDLAEAEWAELIERLGEFQATAEGWTTRATEEWAARFTADGRRR